MANVMRDYRLDLWRIIAVCLVIIHHLLPEDFPNARIGVDVFIIIAGFLSVEAYKRTGTWIGYIEKRVRRIYPEMLVLLLICLILSICFTTNQRLRDVGSTVVASIFSSSNILFSIKSGYSYGLADASANPLMHLWSLGLEMQFYLIVPFLFGFLKTQSPLRVFIVTSIFVGSLYLTLVNFQGTYYLLTSRLWEFMLGFFVAIITKTYPIQSNRSLSIYILASVAIVSLGLSDFGIYDAFLPQWAVALIVTVTLYFPKPSFMLSRGALKILSRFGYESYSIYLAHYPAIVFGGTLSLIYNINFVSIFIFLFLSILVLTSKGGEWLRKYCGRASIFLVVILFFTGLFFWKEPSARPWLAFDQFDPTTITKAGEDARLDGVCNTIDSSAKALGCSYGHGGVKIALIGDSFGAALISGFDDKFYGEKYTLYQFTKNGCPFSTKIFTMPDRLCYDFNRSIEENIRKINPDIIVVNYRWWSYSYRNSGYNIRGAPGYVYCLSGDCDDDMMRFGVDQGIVNEYYASVAKLTALAPRVVVISPTPEYVDMIPEVVGFLKKFRSDSETNIDLPIRDVARDSSLEIFQNMLAIPGVEGIDIYNLFSSNNKLHALKNGEVLFYDSNHLSVEGARIVWQRLDNFFSLGY
jgi:peptidoglycan/LPS O-acetylase OafA/YrhL